MLSEEILRKACKQEKKKCKKVMKQLEREINSGLESEATMRQAVINISVLKFLELVGSADPPLRKQLFVSNLLANAEVSLESILPSNDNCIIRYPLVPLATEEVRAGCYWYEPMIFLRHKESFKCSLGLTELFLDDVHLWTSVVVIFQDGEFLELKALLVMSEEKISQPRRALHRTTRKSALSIL